MTGPPQPHVNTGKMNDIRQDTFQDPGLQSSKSMLQQWIGLRVATRTLFNWCHWCHWRRVWSHRWCHWWRRWYCCWCPGCVGCIIGVLSLMSKMYGAHSTLLEENMQWWSTLNSKHHCSLEREEDRSVLTSAAFTLHLTCKKIKKKAHILLTWCGSQVAAKLPQQQLAIDLGTSCSICSGSWLIIVMVPKTHRKLWNTSSVLRMILYHLYLTKTLLSLLWLSLWWSAYTHPPNLLHKCCAGARESGNKETLVPRVLPPSKNVHMNACLGVIYKWLLDSTSNAHSVSQNEWLIIFVHVRNAIPL